MNPRLRPVLDVLSASIDQVHKGSLSPSQGSSIAALCTALVRVVETSEMEARLVVLEARYRRSDEF